MIHSLAANVRGHRADEVKNATRRVASEAPVGRAVIRHLVLRAALDLKRRQWLTIPREERTQYLLVVSRKSRQQTEGGHLGQVLCHGAIVREDGHDDQRHDPETG